MAGELEGVQKALRELSKALKSLPKDPAPKEIHKLRTASKRAATIAGALPPAEGKKSRRFVKALEPVRKAAGGVRDMDVLAAHARTLKRRAAGESLGRLIDHLETVRDQNSEELRSELQERRKEVREKLKDYSRHVQAVMEKPISGNGGGEQTHETLHAAARRVLCELGGWAPLDASNIHEFRLKVKDLRYILQLDADADGPFVEALGKVKDRVGDWHDWQQLEEIAREVLHAEQDAELLARIGRTAQRKLEKALAEANGLRGRYLDMPRRQGI